MEMETKAGKTLAWQAVNAANQAYDELAGAKAEQEALKELAQMGLNGVSIEPDAFDEIDQRVATASREFTNILKITEILGVKDNNPNPTSEKPAGHITGEDQALAEELLENGVIEWKEDTPVIAYEGFIQIAEAIYDNKGTDVGPLASRAFGGMLRVSDRNINGDKFLVVKTEGYNNGFFDASNIVELNKYLQETHNSPWTSGTQPIANFGQKSADLFNVVTEFVTNNSEVLFARKSA